MRINYSICIFLFIFCFHHTNVRSQVPGYMGKHVIIEYSNYAFPCLLGPTSNKTNVNSSTVDYIADSKFLGFNMTHSIDLNFISNYRKSICVSGQYLKTGVDYRSSLGRSVYKGDMSKPAQLNSFAISLGIKLFRRAHFAPYGAYVKWEGLLYFSNLKYNHNDYYLYDGGTNFVKTSGGTGDLDFTNLGIALSFGKQRIFKDKFLLDYGVRIVGLPEVYGYLADQESGRVSEQFEIDSNFRLERHEFLNFHIGIGFLAF